MNPQFITLKFFCDDVITTADITY